MNKKTKFLASMVALLIVATMFSSCATTYTASGTNVSKIDELAFIEPRSLIYYFSPESGYLDSSLVVGSEELITEIITSSRYPSPTLLQPTMKAREHPLLNGLTDSRTSNPPTFHALKYPKHLPS